MQYTLINDKELTDCFIAGSESAFRDIYDRYWEKLYTIAISKVKVQESAREIVQDIFLDLWQRRAEIRINVLEHYLMRAVKYKVLDHYKKETLKRRYEKQVWYDRGEANRQTEEEVAYRELHWIVREGMDSLPSKTREVFDLNRFGCKSAPEISDLLGIPVRTVEYHISQGLRRMRDHLKEFIVSLLWVILNLP